jgi:ribose-phosphate pyrophosphokinase
MIVSASTSQSVAARLASELDEPLAAVEYERFPDGEQIVRLTDDVADERVVVVGATPTDAAHVELLLLQDAVRESGASSVVTVVPYMGYARQDQQFTAGEPVSARAMARAISTGTDRILTVTPHEETVCEYFTVPATAVDAASVLAEPLPKALTDPVVLSPDSGALTLAEAVRDAYGDGTVDHFEKTRHSGTDVTVTPSEVAVEGRDVVIVDDIIATGSTMTTAIETLTDRGADRVFVSCVHPLLAGDARSKLARAGVEAIYGTDTLERVVSEVSVAPAIAERLQS